MARPREFDETKALEQAMHLFWSKGYEATSLQDLLVAMSLSKSSFYQTFKSKHDLLERSIKQYRQIVSNDMSCNFQNADSGMQFIQGTLLTVAEKVNECGGRRGCLVMNCANEFAQNDPVIAELVAEGTDQFRQAFLVGVERAQQEGDIPAGKDALVLADYMISCKTGLETMAQAGASRDQMTSVAQVMISALR